MVHRKLVRFALVTNWIAKVVRITLQAALLMVFLTVEHVEIADGVLRNVLLLIVVRAHVLVHTMRKGFAVDQDQLLREKWQIARDEFVSSGDRIFLHAK